MNVYMNKCMFFSNFSHENNVSSFCSIISNSYHPSYMSKSLPKSSKPQVCRYIKNYDKNICRRDYMESKLQIICNSVLHVKRETPHLQKSLIKSNKVTLVLPFHHKSRGIKQVLQKMLKEDSNMQSS